MPVAPCLTMVKSNDGDGGQDDGNGNGNGGRKNK
jgi:hypothetical protein